MFYFQSNAKSFLHREMLLILSVYPASCTACEATSRDPLGVPKIDFLLKFAWSSTDCIEVLKAKFPFSFNLAEIVTERNTAIFQSTVLTAESAFLFKTIIQEINCLKTKPDTSINWTIHLFGVTVRDILIIWNEYINI